ncbi:hypothetical protein [Phascolarctobacterium faecium]|uniref:hypothetical protein n=1 Tax=Phascolarctobacterium faecium TaxID=33025 RepID=UPI003A37F2EC
MKKLLALFGIISVAAYVYIVEHKARRKNENDKTASSADIAEIVPSGQEEVHTNTVKAAVLQSIAARHKEAAKIASEAVDTIYAHSNTSDDENQTLDTVSEQLDDLLKEE